VILEVRVRVRVRVKKAYKPVHMSAAISSIG
jgi:hypothetical protein